MDVPLACKVEGKKYLWDGATYLTREEAGQAMEAYQQDGFEVHLCPDGDRYLVYTRRVVTVQSGG